jgi:MinD-like ATPase involved in chromosome partitioning or flagellar assembly
VDEVFGRLDRACLRFLGLHLHEADWLPADPQVALAGKAEKPFVLSAAAYPAARRLKRLAEAVAQETQSAALGRSETISVEQTSPALTVDGRIVELLED